MSTRTRLDLVVRLSRLLSAGALAAGLVACGSGEGNSSADGGSVSVVLSVSVGGRVQLQGSSFTCTNNCSTTLPAGSTLNLTAFPDAGYTFAEWSGACTGSGSCSVNVGSSVTIGATFQQADNKAPEVQSTLPADGETNVWVADPITLNFTEPIDCNTVNSQSFSVDGVTGASVTCQGAVANLNFSSPLAYSTPYTVRVSSLVRDPAGNPLVPRTWRFTTVAKAQFTFLAYGDSRSGNGCDGNAVHISLVNRMVNEPATMVFHLGDMVTGYDRSTNWVQRGDCPSDASKGSLKEIIAPLQNKAPAAGLPAFFFPVVGNHDDSWGDGWYPDPFGNGFCDVFNPSALIPNHTQKSYFLDKSGRVPRYSDPQFQSLACSKTDQSVYPTYMYYSFDFKNTHFVILRLNSDYYNLEECGGGCNDPANYDQYYYKHQLDWLKSDLALAAGRSDIQNVVVLLHAPIFTASWGHAANVSWPTLSKLFSANGKVKIVLQGHNHVYERSVPIFASATYPSGVRDDAKGTVYTTTGGGGSAVHGFNVTSPLNVVQNTEFHYLRLDVDGPTINVKAIRPNGTVFDAYKR